MGIDIYICFCIMSCIILWLNTAVLKVESENAEGFFFYLGLLEFLLKYINGCNEVMFGLLSCSAVWQEISLMSSSLSH